MFTQLVKFARRVFAISACRSSERGIFAPVRSVIKEWDRLPSSSRSRMDPNRLVWVDLEVHHHSVGVASVDNELIEAPYSTVALSC